MESRATAILLMLSLGALLLVVGAGAVADDILLLPSDAVMVEARPWDCCDNPVCTRSGLCACKDVVGECAAACKNCKAVGGSEIGPVGYQCRDASPGGAPRKCTE